MDYVYKEKFSVLGKLGAGPAENPWNWIGPIWEEANNNFNQIEVFAHKNSEGKPGIWGIMSDFEETFARWNEQGGKYLACCEVKEDAAIPEGWVKWDVPAQTYIVARCSQEEYFKVFSETIKEYIPNNHLSLIGAVHEHYPEPGNPAVVELYFPIAKGNYFCQSCGMPMKNKEDRGTNKDGSYSEDYCHYCFDEGDFTKEETMEEMIESCIPFELESGLYKDAQTAKASMLSYFPKMKRWNADIPVASQQ